MRVPSPLLVLGRSVGRSFGRSVALLVAPALVLAAALTLSACDNSGGLGAPCDSTSECSKDLQCVHQVCISKCERAAECGDGFTCSAEGLCEEATGPQGSSCDSETDCKAGLACVLNKSDDDQDGSLQASCDRDTIGHAIGHACSKDGDCRNGTCALGRCVDLCSNQRDCPLGLECTTLPRVEAGGAVFRGCLPERALLTWDIPVPSPTSDVLVPVPFNAISLSLSMSVADESQLVGASLITSPPRGDKIFDRRDSNEVNKLRHRALPNLSVLQIPSSSGAKLEPGTYHVSLGSLRLNGQPGSATPRLKATIRTGKTDDTALLQLHFHFLDLSDYACSEHFEATKTNVRELNAAVAARVTSAFQASYITELRSIFAKANVAISATYEDLTATVSAPYDSVTSENQRALLALGKHKTGINIFLVRGISPVGVAAIGPSPGPAGGSAGPSGIIISLEPLCYRNWTQLARTTAHQLARYMGLVPNRDVTGLLDPIDDSDDSADNLMFFSENGGTKVSPGQRAVLVASPAAEGIPSQ